MNTPHHYHLQGDNHSCALDLLANQTGLSKAYLKAAAQKGAVWLSSETQIVGAMSKQKTQRIRRLKRTLKLCETIDFYYNPEVLNCTVPAATLIRDFESYSIWIKPRGMFSQGSKWGDFSALYRWVELYFQELGKPRQSWIVHRLDRATHGLMIVAHTKNTARYFSQQFENGNISKCYQANIEGAFLKHLNSLPAGQLERLETLENNQYLVTEPVEQKPAKSIFSERYFCESENFSRVHIQLLTGRKHQIRRHFAYLQTPILGDRLYNLKAQESHAQHKPQPDLQLSAFSLNWTCPIDHSTQQIVLDEADLNLLDCTTNCPSSHQGFAE